MKTYTHPTINLPAGAVVVKFYDESLSGLETTDDIIKEIGDVEEGFDIVIGEFYSPTCDFVLHNKDNYVLGTLLNTVTLAVSVTVDNELYFLGDVELNSVNSDVLEFSSTVAVGNISFTAIGRLAKLARYKVDDLYADIDASYPTWIYMPVLFLFFNAFLGLKSAATTDTVMILDRMFRDTNSFPSDNLDKIVLSKDYLLTHATRDNYYRNRFEKSYDILGELAREFFFFPSIIYDGTDFKFQIMERDVVRTVTGITVIDSNPSKRYAMYSLHTYLNNTPDGFSMTGLEYTDEQSYEGLGDEQDFPTHHSSIARSSGGYDTNMMIYIVNQSTAINYIKSVGTVYTSFQEAMHNAYKDVYFDNSKWREIRVKGLTAIYSASTKLQYLKPAYRFSFLSETHHIHSVRKSVMKNESVLEALVI